MAVVAGIRIDRYLSQSVPNAQFRAKMADWLGKVSRSTTPSGSHAGTLTGLSGSHAGTLRAPGAMKAINRSLKCDNCPGQAL